MNSSSSAPAPSSSSSSSSPHARIQMLRNEIEGLENELSLAEYTLQETKNSIPTKQSEHHVNTDVLIMAMGSGESRLTLMINSELIQDEKAAMDAEKNMQAELMKKINAHFDSRKNLIQFAHAKHKAIQQLETKISMLQNNIRIKTLLLNDMQEGTPNSNSDENAQENLPEQENFSNKKMRFSSSTSSTSLSNLAIPTTAPAISDTRDTVMNIAPREMKEKSYLELMLNKFLTANAIADQKTKTTALSTLHVEMVQSFSNTPTLFASAEDYQVLELLLRLHLPINANDALLNDAETRAKIRDIYSKNQRYAGAIRDAYKPWFNKVVRKELVNKDSGMTLPSLSLALSMSSSSSSSSNPLPPAPSPEASPVLSSSAPVSQFTFLNAQQTSTNNANLANRAEERKRKALFIYTQAIKQIFIDIEFKLDDPALKGILNAVTGYYKDLVNNSQGMPNSQSAINLNAATTNMIKFMKQQITKLNLESYVTAFLGHLEDVMKYFPLNYESVLIGLFRKISDRSDLSSYATINFHTELSVLLLDNPENEEKEAASEVDSNTYNTQKEKALSLRAESIATLPTLGKLDTQLLHIRRDNYASICYNMLVASERLRKIGAMEECQDSLMRLIDVMQHIGTDLITSIQKDLDKDKGRTKYNQTELQTVTELANFYLQRALYLKDQLKIKLTPAELLKVLTLHDDMLDHEDNLQTRRDEMQNFIRLFSVEKTLNTEGSVREKTDMRACLSRANQVDEPSSPENSIARKSPKH